MKSYKLIIPAMVAATFLAAGAVSAQTTGTGAVNVTVTPTTSSITPGTGVTLGTVAFTSDATGATVTSIPITLGANGGASVGNLSNCRFYNAAGTAVTGNIGTPVTGANSFVFSSPLAVSTGTGTQTLSLRCDVASSTPTGSTFSITTGTVGFTTGLRVNLDTAPSVPAGSTNVALANILLDTSRSGGTVSVSAIPVSISAGSGGSLGNLMNCRIRPSLDASTNLSGTQVITGSTQTFSLTSPFVAAAGQQTSLALACDVSASTPVGSTFTIAITPSNIPAVGTGGAITPTAGNTSGTVIVTATVTGGTPTPTPTPTPDTGTPGVPNTGLGGSAQTTLAVLLFSALAALGGTYVLRRRSA